MDHLECDDEEDLELTEVEDVVGAPLNPNEDCNDARAAEKSLGDRSEVDGVV